MPTPNHTQFNDDQDLDSAGDDAALGGVNNGSQDDADPQNEDNGFEPKEITDQDQGTENQDTGEGAEEDNGDSGETQQVEKAAESPEMAALRQELESVKQKLTQRDQPQVEQPKPHVFSEEEKANILNISGFQDFRQVEFVNNMMGNMIKNIQMFVETKLGSFGQSSAIDSFAKSPQFADAVKYRSGIEEFLNTQPAHLRTDAKTLEIAYHVARSKGLKSETRKKMVSMDRNKRIVTQARPRGGEQQKRSAVGLTGEELAMARAARISPEEYAKFKRPLRVL